MYLRLRQEGPTVPCGHVQTLGETQRPPFKHGWSQTAKNGFKCQQVNKGTPP